MLLGLPRSGVYRPTPEHDGGGAYLNELDGNLTNWSEAFGESTTLHWQGKLRGADFAPVSFALNPIKIDGLTDGRGRPILSVVATLQPEEQAEKSVQLAVNEGNTVLELLRRHPGITLRDIASNAGWLLPNGKANYPKVQRILRKLRKDKLAEPWRGKWRITSAGKHELGAE